MIITNEKHPHPIIDKLSSLPVLGRFIGNIVIGPEVKIYNSQKQGLRVYEFPQTVVAEQDVVEPATSMIDREAFERAGRRLARRKLGLCTVNQFVIVSSDGMWGDADSVVLGAYNERLSIFQKPDITRITLEGDETVAGVLDSSLQMLQ